MITTSKKKALYTIAIVVWLLISFNFMMQNSLSFSNWVYKKSTSSRSHYSVGKLNICNDFKGVAIPHKSYLLDMNLNNQHRSKNMMMLYDWLVMPSEVKLIYLNVDDVFISIIEVGGGIDTASVEKEVILAIQKDNSGEVISMQGMKVVRSNDDGVYSLAIPSKGVVITTSSPDKVNLLHFENDFLQCG